jgi:hypothetical protein
MATASKPKLRTYSIWARGTFEVSIEIDADSLDAALAKSKELKLEDFIEILGDHNDSSYRITGIFEQS